MSDPIEYCECCEKIKLLQWINSKSDDKEFEYKISVALVSTSHKRNKKTVRGRTTHYQKNGIGFPLNFCPECAKALKEA